MAMRKTGAQGQTFHVWGVSLQDFDHVSQYIDANPDGSEEKEEDSSGGEE